MNNWLLGLLIALVIFALLILFGAASGSDPQIYNLF